MKLGHLLFEAPFRINILCCKINKGISFLKNTIICNSPGDLIQLSICKYVTFEYFNVCIMFHIYLFFFCFSVYVVSYYILQRKLETLFCNV